MRFCTRYNPDSLLEVDTFTPVASLVTATAAPGSNACWLSAITPVISTWRLWPRTVILLKNSKVTSPSLYAKLGATRYVRCIFASVISQAAGLDTEREPKGIQFLKVHTNILWRFVCVKRCRLP